MVREVGCVWDGVMYSWSSHQPEFSSTLLPLSLLLSLPPSRVGSPGGRWFNRVGRAWPQPRVSDTELSLREL